MKVTKISDKADSLLLRSTSSPLTRRELGSPYTETLAKRMLATVTAPENDGVGIAAPQVGVGRRLIIVQRFDKEGEPFEVFANPVITGHSAEKRTGPEGCLSIDGVRGDVERWEWIDLGYDLPFVQNMHVNERVEGFTAVIFQHEIDHLDGKLFIDYLK